MQPSSSVGHRQGADTETIGAYSEATGARLTRLLRKENFKHIFDIRIAISQSSRFCIQRYKEVKIIQEATAERNESVSGFPVCHRKMK